MCLSLQECNKSRGNPSDGRIKLKVPAVLLVKSEALFITLCRLTGKQHLSKAELSILIRFTKIARCNKNASLCSWISLKSWLFVQTSRSNQKTPPPILTCPEEIPHFKGIVMHLYSSKMSFNLQFSWLKHAGNASSVFSHSFLSLLDFRFMQRALICSAILWVNTFWKGFISVEESVTPLTHFPLIIKVKLCFFHSPPVSHIRWLHLDY